MRRLRAAAQTAAVLYLTLVVSWLLPPVLQRARRLCPVRPNGIGQAEAIPTFARKYKTSCTTCHAPVPIKLNNFGEAFKNSGFRMPSNDEGLTKIEMQELGASAWKENWKKDIYPGVIPTELPISFQMYLDARYDPHKESAGTRNARSVYWDVPHEFELMSAGTLGKHMSFWANVEFKVKTPQAVQNSTSKAIQETPVDFVQVYGQLDHLLDTSLLNVRVGRFEPRAVPFSRVSRRFIAEDLLTSGHSLKNGFNFKTMQGGAELWGAKSIAQTGGGLVYAVGLLNGDGDSNGDNNRTQDVYARLSYKFGGMGVADGLESSDSLNVSKNWVDDSVRLGVYGYRGAATAKGLGYRIGGADVDVWFKNLNLYANAWTGMEDLDLPTTAFGSKGQKSTSWTLGADYIAWPWLTGILRYEAADQGNDASKHIRRVIPAVVVGIRPNITWTTEAYFYNSYAKTTGTVTTGDEMLRTRLRFIF